MQFIPIMATEIHYCEADNLPGCGAALENVIFDFFQKCRRILKDDFEKVAFEVIPDFYFCQSDLPHQLSDFARGGAPLLHLLVETLGAIVAACDDDARRQ